MIFILSATNQETPYEQLLHALLKNNGSPIFQLPRVKILKGGKNVLKISFKIGLELKKTGVYVFSNLKR